MPLALLRRDRMEERRDVRAALDEIVAQRLRGSICEPVRADRVPHAIQKPGSGSWMIVCNWAGSDAYSTCSRESTIASSRDAGAGSVLTTTSETPRGTSTSTE